VYHNDILISFRLQTAIRRLNLPSLLLHAIPESGFKTGESEMKPPALRGSFFFVLVDWKKRFFSSAVLTHPSTDRFGCHNYKV